MTTSSVRAATSCFSRYRFTGKERDAESGNDYFGARYYSSSMGRFMSPDWSAKIEPVPYAKLAQQPISLDRLTTILYHEMGSLSPNPDSEPGQAGSAEDLHNGRVAVGEVVLTRFHTKHHRIGIDIASDKLSSDEKRAIKNGVPAVVSALADTRAAAQVAYGGSNTMNGAQQYRTRYNGDITGNLGRTRSSPGTPLSAHFGPFINSTGGTAVEVIAP
jgi:RHS repeat-associated protein